MGSTLQKCDILQKCFENICKNFNIPASLKISEPISERDLDDIFNVFVDVNACSYINFYEKEIWKNFSKIGIKSKKDYRKLRSLARTRLIDAIYQMRDLTEESLRNLGVKEFSETVARNS